MVLRVFFVLLDNLKKRKIRTTSHLSNASAQHRHVHSLNVLFHRMRLVPGEDDFLSVNSHFLPSAVLQHFAERRYVRYLLVRKAEYVLVIQQAATACALGMHVVQL